MNELKIIELIKKRFTQKSSKIIKGIGDDTAAVLPSSEIELYTTDMMLEGIHFDLSFITASQLGFKLISRNVSDIFAMGGIPEFLLLNLALPEGIKEDFVEDFLDGLHKGTDRYGITLVGGDFSLSPGYIFLSAMLKGSASRIIQRSGARPGDIVYVTGTLGDAACGLEIMKRKAEIKKEIREPLIKKHLMPEPQPLHNKIKKINAMIDISDGLSLDLWRLCMESRRGAIIFEEKIPLSEELLIAAETLGLDPLKLALSGGEDYELLFTTDEKVTIEGITQIGIITEEEGIRIIKKNGQEKSLIPEGYIHKSSGNNI
ncbi:MAG: thiamine-phosphate kinase [Thermodesulfovibrionales bacterium]|nr:thiamine-phosphate kinase [Thermodesulfovibrionales bacterium]